MNTKVSLGLAFIVVLAVGAAAGYFFRRPPTAFDPAERDRLENQISILEGQNLSLQKELSSVRQNPPPTAQATTTPDGWQTYSNSKYNFSISFPPEWSIRVADPETGKPGFFIFKQKSQLAILPQGGFDHNLPWDPPEESQLNLGGNNFQVRTYLKSGLALYQMSPAIENWKSCPQNLENCNRIELDGGKKEELENLRLILNTLIFFP
jgi:hypothetical protein